MYRSDRVKNDIDYPYTMVPDHVSNYKYCCKSMEGHAYKYYYQCTNHGYGCPDRPIALCKGGIFLVRASNTEYIIKYCPWCGIKLNEDQYDEANARRYRASV